MTLTFTAIACCCALSGCGDSDDENPPVTITVAGPNAVSFWNEVATATINVPASAAGVGTSEEQRSNSAVDLATVHIAVYDAVIAIAGTHRPFAITPRAPAAGASEQAAAAAAAYGVLLGLFPNRGAQYQAAYDSFLADGQPGFADGEVGR